MSKNERYLFQDGYYHVELKINQLQQLFSSHDPAPFRERDLDDDAVEYIMESLKEIKFLDPVKLVIHLPEEEIKESAQKETAAAIHNYFSYEEVLTQKKMKALFKQGQFFLLIGFLFLLGCMYSSYFILKAADSVFLHILGEGLNIIGWVAMWKPIEILLYDWRPLSRARKYYQKLMMMEVELVPFKKFTS
ncbi:MAG: hypothetical protein COX62_06600 [Deltaproteobacteria bacterium CG_4_10_14_0_2_um_filter_43_8]|nr:MAG: hypothetical protein COV43_01980 [Deltaproteobacteria bacterium CG11_big_fil_rev_8_21_14_0_20_42_23]PJA19484.1 MAG: hypothetical protein COX62_06600 [Deltaproteobacteria bacterium CG_4_10_14_0_2_um_filter_43_8]PJC63882.1 MAG: hypothetical protein CO021_07160 [Deltaproteobacteria bacterium CG_4_9_14_0_2_um_filter_42_21]